MNNLQIEVKRHKLQQQFLEQIEFGNHSQENLSDCQNRMSDVTKTSGNYSPQIQRPLKLPSGADGSKCSFDET